MSDRSIKVEQLARVEGEGSLYVRVKGEDVADVTLRIFEPPRFFEALLRGRRCEEAPDITSRICGICPVSHQITACQAVEYALGLEVESEVRELRRLLYCGEWIQSHALHIYMLHAPDFLGYDDAIEIARDRPEVIRRALQLKHVGNQIVAAVGGRGTHPINVRVGGFYRVPSLDEIAPLVEQLKWAVDAALDTVRFTSALRFPELEMDYEFVALRHAAEYPVTEGRIVSSSGLDVSPDEFEARFREEHEPFSSALRSEMRGRGVYLLGPLARFTLNRNLLTPAAKHAAAEAGLEALCRNPFRSIVVRSVEMLWACEEALRIVSSYTAASRPSVPLEYREGAGSSCTEAPRGLLYHRYTLDANGLIQEARIVPPTAQNQKQMEADVREVFRHHRDLDRESLTLLCEQAVRNHDPCISCATHFLRLRIERE